MSTTTPVLTMLTLYLDECADIIKSSAKQIQFVFVKCSLIRQIKCMLLENWRDDSVVTSTDWPNRGSKFDSEHPHGNLQPSLSNFRGSSGLCGIFGQTLNTKSKPNQIHDCAHVIQIM